MNNNFEVKKTFIDKETNVKYEVGSCYETSSQARAAELERGGYIAPAESIKNAKANYQANQKAAEKTNVSEREEAKAHAKEEAKVNAAQVKTQQAKAAETKAAKAKAKTDEV